MKINKIKINGFGKLSEKEIELNDKINIIYGKNEAGKSTLLKFIVGMFYGLSKNKNGQSVPDIEKFEPWNNGEFSGKLKYELDDDKKFEVYRDFKKKNPKIFNENLEDVSKEFNIDKTKGNRFFYDQIGLEEELFTNSVVTKQGEVKLDEKSQNSIIQKISNILGTGEDNSSYTKILAKLKKKINDEIGTNNTKDRPINVIEKRITEIEKEKVELEKYQNYKFKIDDEIKKNKLQIIEQKEKLETLKSANIRLETLKAEQSKINIIKKMIDDTEKEINDLNKINQKEISELKDANIKLSHKIIGGILSILSIIAIIFIKNNIIKFIPLVTAVMFLILIFMKNNKNKNKIKESRREHKNGIKNLQNKKDAQREELETLESNYKKSIKDICDKYNINNVSDIIEQINNVQSIINELTLKIHTIEFDNNNISPKLEKFINLEEELESLKDDKYQLEKKREEIKKAIEILEISYNKMKEEITPKFTDNLSKTIEKISNQKYKNVRINTSGEILVEDKNGEYINAENLSVGTIDQLYLSLRLASIEEITKESMPILLDEAFAYYDDTRLNNILEFLAEEYNERQIIIFTCTKREEQSLQKLNLDYNMIEL